MDKDNWKEIGTIFVILSKPAETIALWCRGTLLEKRNIDFTETASTSESGGWVQDSGHQDSYQADVQPLHEASRDKNEFSNEI